MWDDVQLCLPAVAVGVGTSWRPQVRKRRGSWPVGIWSDPTCRCLGPAWESQHPPNPRVSARACAGARTGVGQSAPPALATVCLSLCFPLASPGLCPHLVHHVPLRGVAPVSESAVRCSVYLKGSSWSALSHSNPDIATHTGMYLCPRPRPPRQSPPDPIFPVITTNS